MLGNKIIGFLAVFVILTLCGCAGGPLTTREKLTYGGGAIGAATGAIIGAATGSAAVGAVIGGPVGAIGGYLIGDSIQAQGGGGGSPARQGAAKNSNCQVGGYSRKANVTSQSKPDATPQKSGNGGEVF
jgi:osmotically inducible lipoprotein OsmB